MLSKRGSEHRLLELGELELPPTKGQVRALLLPRPSSFFAHWQTRPIGNTGKHFCRTKPLLGSILLLTLYSHFETRRVGSGYCLGPDKPPQSTAGNEFSRGEITQGQKRKENYYHMTNRNKIFGAMLVAVTCVALLPAVQAAPQVAPPPDGCYPNFTTAEGCNALGGLTSGAGNTGVGWFALFSAA